MGASATLDLIAHDRRFLKAMDGVKRSVDRVRAQMEKAARTARRMLLVGAGALAGLLKLASDQIAAETRLEAVLKATGNAAGLSAAQIKAHASELQNLTGVGDETIIQMQAVLATFKQVKGDQFRRATTAILDMAAVLRIDLQSAAIQVGKALNDPLRGVSMLSRSGITFTDVQLDMIKALVKSSDMIGAQSIVLKELETQFGGTAEEIGKTFVGSVKRAMAAIGDVGEAIGTVFIPKVQKLIDLVVKNKDRMVKWVREHKAAIVAITAMGTVLTIFTVAVHAAAMAFRAIMIAVRGLNLALHALKANPVIAALSLLAAGALYLRSKLEASNRATEKLLNSKQELADASDELAQAVEREATAEEKATKRRKDAITQLKKRGAETKSDVEKARATLGKEIATFGMTPDEAQLWRLRRGGATDEQLKTIEKQQELLRIMNAQAAAEEKKAAAIKKAAEDDESRRQRAIRGLADEADKIRDLIKTDEQRKREQLDRIALLERMGRLTAEEAALAREKLAIDKRGAVSAMIEDAQSMYRRIAAAAGGRRPGGATTVSPAQQSAQANAETAQASKRTADSVTKTNVTLQDIYRLIQDIVRGGLKTQPVYQ